MDSFSESVLRLAAGIPKGKISTYRQIAVALGRPNAARAVGNALNKNPHLIEVPCHRVVKSNGAVGNYALGAERKIALLKKEGIEIKKGRISELETYLYDF
ncbi:MAG: MGMT family protein [Candidatus Diapherotrites archaeon]|nr:MGMT family protein [Candidatus Diapherotrites archaeon]